MNSSGSIQYEASVAVNDARNETLTLAFGGGWGDDPPGADLLLEFLEGHQFPAIDHAVLVDADGRQVEVEVVDERHREHSINALAVAVRAVCPEKRRHPRALCGGTTSPKKTRIGGPGQLQPLVRSPSNVGWPEFLAAPATHEMRLRPRLGHLLDSDKLVVRRQNTTTGAGHALVGGPLGELSGMRTHARSGPPCRRPRRSGDSSSPSIPAAATTASAVGSLDRSNGRTADRVLRSISCRHRSNHSPPSQSSQSASGMRTRSPSRPASRPPRRPTCPGWL